MYSYTPPVSHKLYHEKICIYSSLLHTIFVFYLFPPRSSLGIKTRAAAVVYTDSSDTAPFCVLSYVILRSEILPKKFSACYIVLCGFLFGFPIGCKLTADFYSSNYISREKASALCCFTNNLSPVFVITAIQEILQLPLSPGYVFLIYGIPFLYGMSMLLLYHRTPSSTQKETASRFHMDMQIIDAGIIHGFETLIKICGYIILFSIFCEMLQTLPFPAHWFSLAATGFLEVTNGVALLSTSACTRQIKSLLAVLFLSWGGLSGIFQVSSILHQTGLSLRNYVLQKIILLLLTVGCCIPLLFLGILI